MNILPKKSWHVRTRKNIDKVRKDEAEAAEKDKQVQARILLAEQEARTDFLRKRARQLADPSDLTEDLNPTEHLDLFSGVSLGKGDQRTNVEHVAEAKAQKEKWEKQIGILQYLNQGNEEMPWYTKLPTEKKLTEKEKDLANNEQEVKDAQSKYYHDPLNTMQKYLGQMKKSKSSLIKGSTFTQLNSKETKGSRETESMEQEKSKSKKSKKAKRHSHKKSKHSHSHEVTGSDNNKIMTVSKEEEEKKQKLEFLRAERLKREKVERERVRQLMNKSSQEIPSSSFKVLQDDRNRAYNSRFNPHLARK